METVTAPSLNFKSRQQDFATRGMPASKMPMFTRLVSFARLEPSSHCLPQLQASSPDLGPSASKGKTQTCHGDLRVKIGNLPLGQRSQHTKPKMENCFHEKYVQSSSRCFCHTRIAHIQDTNV